VRVQNGWMMLVVLVAALFAAIAALALFRVEGPAGVDTLQIASRWHGTGEGRARISVLAGDQAGLIWVDCWAATSLTSYNELKRLGDPSTCIPDL